MTESLLVFDIETVPDVVSGRRLYDLAGLDDRQVAEAMFACRRQETEGKHDFLPYHLHQIVAISVLLKTDHGVTIWSLGTVASKEQEIIEKFFRGIEQYSPTLVSWNGSGFDLPVLHYRGLLYCIEASGYWENGTNDQSFRWNNYINRYHERHTDLMDVLAAYTMAARVRLDQMATFLGFPGKMGMSGEKVWTAYLNGEIELIRKYCETDVLNTYLVYLRYERMRGRLNQKTYQEQCEEIKVHLEQADKQHFKQFLDAWQA